MYLKFDCRSSDRLIHIVTTLRCEIFDFKITHFSDFNNDGDFTSDSAENQTPMVTNVNLQE